MPAQRSAAAAVRTLLALSGLLAADLAWSASAPDRVGAAVVGARLADRIVGTWELVSYKVEDKETSTLVDAMGGTPRGRVIFTKDGWVAFNLEGSARTPATTDAERAALMKTLVAYIGRYRIEGDQWVTSVQTAWAPEWVGTEQRRTIHIDGDCADVTTPWRVMPNWDDGRLSRSIIRFKHIP
ncbi:lipocalin-like domain-containing protein [Methylobacterium sp. NPDC080182]|uniref:lipocalin-like domain-containing protein n=1 Tax=Methylobacterium sp. NPDC080182 TaxID=3390590 RepID=UPI003D062A56